MNVHFYMKNFKVLAQSYFSAYFVTAGFNPLRRKFCSQETALRTHLCGSLKLDDVNRDVTLCGWVQYRRLDLFLVIRDWQGCTQVVLEKSELKEKLDKFPLESVVRVHGRVRQRPDGQQNKSMNTGDIEVVADNLELLNTCSKDVPFLPQDFSKVRESLGMQYRYLQLRNTELQKNLRLRSKVLLKMRNFLCNKHSFVDVETPTLFRRTPGGAREFIVPTHTEGKYFTLPQSPQQFKQLLMVGGIDRYMQVARCYRDESAKPDRQPEFTQVDLEMSFVSREDIKQLIEELLIDCWPYTPPSIPFPSMTYEEAMTQYGSDKPDTRFNMKLSRVSEFFTSCLLTTVTNALLQDGGDMFAINLKQFTKHTTNKSIDVLKKIAEDHVCQRPLWSALIKIKDGGQWQGNLWESMEPSRVDQLTSQMELEPGDVLALCAGPKYLACEILGKIRLEGAKILEEHGAHIRDNKSMNLLWVQDFPLFLPKEGKFDGSLESAHHPFTAPHPQDEDLIYVQPEKVRGLHYDLVLNGSEIAGGSIRIHNSLLQRYVLNDILKEDATSLEHLLTALTFGCPPHGGIAIGYDRLIAILCGASSIRDVIAFPKSSEGKDLMAKAPADITQEDRLYYHIK